MTPGQEAAYARMMAEREAARQYLIAPPRMVSERRPQPAWAYLVPFFVLFLLVAGALVWASGGQLITGRQVNFAVLRSGISQVRLPAGYTRVSSAESGRDCAQDTCVLTQIWAWRGGTARSAADACRDIDRAMNALNQAVKSSFPLARGAACEYYARPDAIVHPGHRKPEIEALVWTGLRAAGSPGGYQVELLAASNYAGP
jgi:hypothetical protein